MKKAYLMVAIIVVACMFMLAGCSGLLGGLLDVEGDEYETAQLKSKAEVEAALGDSYEISVKYGSTSSDSQSGSDESWTTLSTTKVADGYTYTRIIDLSDDDETPTAENHLYGNGMIYTYDVEAQKYTAATKASETYYGGYSYIMSYVGDALDYNTVEDATHLSRACKKYTRSTSITVLGTSMGINYVYYIDNATGICLKYEMSGGVSSSTEGSSSGSISYTVTDLKLSGADLSSEIAKIALVEWPSSEQFSAFGLANVTVPTGSTYAGGSVTYGSGNAITNLSIVLDVANSEAAEAICQTLFNAGASHGYDGDSITFENGALSSADSSYISFTGYSANGSTVSASGFSNGDDFTVTIVFSPNN